MGAELTREIPPCGHVAGQMARTDLAEGVPLARLPRLWSGCKMTVATNDGFTGCSIRWGLTPSGRSPGRGIRIFGADSQQRYRLAIRTFAG